MPIDRKKFLTMAMTLALGGAAACGPKAAPADPNGGGETTGEPTEEGSGIGGEGGDPSGTMPAQECVDWDAEGECSDWAADGGGMYPAEECVEWDAADECIAYESAAE